MSATSILIYLGIGIFAGAVALALFRRRPDFYLIEDTFASVVVGIFWPISIVLGLVTVAVIVMSRVIGRWIEDRWPSKTPTRSDPRLSRSART
jgi:H+/Cl- antiporter ClcA